MKASDPYLQSKDNIHVCVCIVEILIHQIYSVNSLQKLAIYKTQFVLKSSQKKKLKSTTKIIQMTSEETKLHMNRRNAAAQS